MIRSGDAYLRHSMQGPVTRAGDLCLLPLGAGTHTRQVLPSSATMARGTDDRSPPVPADRTRASKIIVPCPGHQRSTPVTPGPKLAPGLHRHLWPAQTTRGRRLTAGRAWISSRTCWPGRGGAPGDQCKALRSAVIRRTAALKSPELSCPPSRALASARVTDCPWLASCAAHKSRSMPACAARTARCP